MDVGLTTWRAVAASVAGAGHRTRGTGCEDASGVVVSDDGSLLMAVADGAGSARLAAEGSRRAIDAAMEAMALGHGLVDVLADARSALEPSADESDAGVVLADRATTLLVVRAGGGVVETAQVGDGAIIIRRDGQLSVLAPDDRGEYLNETCFLTSPGWADAARSTTVPLDGIDALAGLTDGLQLVALDLATGAPHAPFFLPFFEFAASNGTTPALESFLASDRVAERTDDDVTLVVAVLAPSP